MGLRKLFRKRLTRRVRYGIAGRGKQAITLPPLMSTAEPERKLAAVAMIRNEGPYLREWIAFHQLMGVEYFVIYNNSSADDPGAILADHIEDGLVTLIPWPRFSVIPQDRPHVLTQKLAYAHATVLLRQDFQWVTFLDLDEFMFSPSHGALIDILDSYRDLASIAAFWVMFGTSGHEKKPEGGTLLNYTKKMSMNDLIAQARWACKYKSIVQPSRVVAIIGPHGFWTDEAPVHSWTEDRRPLYNTRAKTLICNHLRVNHYYTRSFEEYSARQLNPHEPYTGRTVEMFKERLEAIDRNPVYDDTILKVLNGMGVDPVQLLK